MYFLHKKEGFFVIVFLLVLILSATYFGLKDFTSSTSSETKQKQATEGTGLTQTQQLEVGEIVVEVELADTAEKITKGLSYREVLEENKGMYFILPARQNTSFWMYAMKFPLDIIWIDNGVVVGIEKKAPVPDENNIPTFESPNPVTNVLEVNGGFAEKNEIKVGDKVTLRH